MKNEPELRKVIAEIPWGAIVIPFMLALIICVAFVVIVCSER